MIQKALYLMLAFLSCASHKCFSSDELPPTLNHHSIARKAELLEELLKTLDITELNKAAYEPLVLAYQGIRSKTAHSESYNAIVESKIETVNAGISGCYDKLHNFNLHLQSKIELLLTLFLNKQDME